MRRARIAAALWGGFLLLVTSWPNPPAVVAGRLPVDKLTHFGLYAVEAFLLVRAASQTRGGTLPTALAVIGGMALWGMLDEAHQDWIPGRMMDVGDFFADVGGALVGAVLGVGSRIRTRRGSSA